MIAKKQGAVFLSSHFGNIEICRAWAREFPEVKLNAIFYLQNAAKFNTVLRAMNQNVTLNVYSPHEMTIETGILFQQKVDAGEWIFVMADRVLSETKGRIVKSNFLGEPVELPMGPFAMADVLRVPIFAMHCYRQEGKLNVSLKPLQSRQGLNREQRFGLLANEYVGEIERLVKVAPLQWFNFYKFWKSHAE